MSKTRHGLCPQRAYCVRVEDRPATKIPVLVNHPKYSTMVLYHTILSCSWSLWPRIQTGTEEVVRFCSPSFGDSARRLEQIWSFVIHTSGLLAVMSWRQPAGTLLTGAPYKAFVNGLGFGSKSSLICQIHGERTEPHLSMQGIGIKVLMISFRIITMTKMKE